MKYLFSVNLIQVGKAVLCRNPTYSQLIRSHETAINTTTMKGIKTDQTRSPATAENTTTESKDLPKSADSPVHVNKRFPTSKTLSSKKMRLLGNCDIPVLPIEDEESISNQISSLSHFHTSSILQQSETEVTEKISQPIGLHRFGSEFFNVPCQDLAMRLLGHILVRKLEDGTVLKGRIVETESYLGGEDRASHSFNGKMTDRSEPMYMKPGTAYVYFTYGMYHCFNISSQGAGAAVLIRALEPLEGDDFMLTQRRYSKRKPSNNGNPFSIQMENNAIVRQTKRLKPHELCNGPAKLCISLNIDRQSCNKQDLAIWDGMWIEKSEDTVDLKEHHIVKTSRIGIDSCGIEWATKPLRFYIIDNKCVSRRDLSTEKNLKELATFLHS